MIIEISSATSEEYEKVIKKIKETCLSYALASDGLISQSNEKSADFSEVKKIIMIIQSKDFI